MKPQYSFTKTLGKGALAILSVAAAFATMSGFADFTLWELVQTYGEEMLSGVTVSGLIAMAINFIKFNWMT